jgi:hypothetical protein
MQQIHPIRTMLHYARLLFLHYTLASWHSSQWPPSLSGYSHSNLPLDSLLGAFLHLFLRLATGMHFPCHKVLNASLSHSSASHTYHLLSLTTCTYVSFKLLQLSSIFYFLLVSPFRFRGISAFSVQHRFRTLLQLSGLALPPSH